MTSFILDINNLSYKTIHGHLSGLNINVKYGEIHVLIIKSRSEQEVFLEALTNAPSSPLGKTKIKYKENHLTNNKGNRIAIMKQFPQLIEEFTAEENINFTTFPTRSFIPFIRWSKVKSRSKDLINTLNFSIDLKKKVKNLSENERKVVYISRIMLENPDLIIMQEPLEGLSLTNNETFHQILKQYQNQGGSVLYITKRWEEALRISNRISIFSNGSIIDEIPASVAIKDPRKLLIKLEDYSQFNDVQSKEDDTQKVLEAVFNAAELLSSEYELKDVLLFLIEEIKSILRADGCSIKLIDGETESEINNFEIIDNDNIKFQLKKDTIHRFSKESNVFYSNINDKSFHSLFDQCDNIKTFIAVPVFIRNQVTAIIQVYYKDLYVYSDDEFKYLSTLAKHTAIAIEDTRLMGRSAFLQESHHRIKNNLQSVVGLITLQKAIVRKNPSVSLNDTLDTIISRVKSIASVHDLLAKGTSGRSIINVKEIIQSVISIIDHDAKITINLKLDDLFISYNKATSIALIVNELVTNCFKHAFTEMDSGEIIVTCIRIDDTVELSVCDNGKGFNHKNNKVEDSSLGLTIIKGIVKNDFNGTITFNHNVKNCIQIELPFDALFNL